MCFAGQFPGKAEGGTVRRGFQITGILLDQEDAGFEFSLREFCTNVYRTSQLSRDQIAEQLVVSRVA